MEDKIETVAIVIPDLLGDMVLVREQLPLRERDGIVSRIIEKGIWAEDTPFATDISYQIRETSGAKEIAIGNLLQSNGMPRPDCSRSALTRVLRLSAEAGVRVHVSGTLQGYLVPGGQDGLGFPLGDRVVIPTPAILEEMKEVLSHGPGIGGIRSESDGQISIEYPLSDVVEFCDRIMLSRAVLSSLVWRIEERQCKFCLAPKPTNVAGANDFMMSLLVKGLDKKVVGERAKSLASHGRALALITNPHVNSYKRLTPRNGALRSRAPWKAEVSEVQDVNSFMWLLPGRDDPNLVIRSFDATCNIYLAVAISIAFISSTVDGLERHCNGRLADRGESPRKEQDTPRPVTMPKEYVGDLHVLPFNLGESVEAFVNDLDIQSCLGPLLSSRIVKATRSRWFEYCDAVHPWELREFVSNSLL